MCDPGNGRRRHPHERRRLRARLVRHRGEGVGRHGGWRRVALARRPGLSISPFGARAGPGRRAGRVPPQPAGASRCQTPCGRAECTPQGHPADQPPNVRQRLQEPRSRARRRADARRVRIEGVRGRWRTHLPAARELIENADGASAANAVALMAEARRRALEQYGIELEREVELLGDLVLPPAGELP